MVLSQIAISNTLRDRELLGCSRHAARLFRCSLHVLLGCLALTLLGGLCSATDVLSPASRQLLGEPVAPPSARLQPLGRLPATQALRLALSLPLRNQPDLDRLLKRLYDRGSPDFHKYLTPEQFTARFGPSADDYQRVVGFAESNGLAVIATHRSRLVLDVQGPVANAEKAFHVTLQKYQHPTEPRKFYAPESEPLVPAGLPLLEIRGLADYAQAHPLLQAQKEASLPVAAIGSAPGGNYMGRDFRNAYLPGVSLDGNGQMVGLVEFDGYQASDIAAYEALAGLPPVPLINVPVDGPTAIVGNNSEVSLDIEMAISMAPGLAAVVVFEAVDGGFGTVDLLDSLAASNQIKQFSCSWSIGSSPGIDAAFLKLAAQGQTLFFAAGDSGAYGPHQTVWPESPYATSVGGTRLTMSNSGAGYSSEIVWSTGNTASGGGVSSVYVLPAWQLGLSMVANHGSTSMRNVPDVALTADGIWVTYGGGQSGSFSGTSCAAPLWAGFAAVVNQAAAQYGSPSVGFLNPALYALAQGTNYANCFHDITNGNNTTSLSPSNYYAVRGYDLCTGLGTPAGSNLITTLAAWPVIDSPPQSLLIEPGANATFQTRVTGATPFHYQWQFNNADLPGATDSTLTISNAWRVDTGSYTISAWNAYGRVTSAPATLNFVLPVVTSPPANQVALPGYGAIFEVAVDGLGPFAYQWQFNGTNLPNNLISTVAGSGIPDDSGDGGPAITACLNFPVSVALDPTGNLFIADELNQCVRRVDTYGNITTLVAAGFGDATSADGGGVAVDAFGNIYIADYLNHLVNKVAPDGLITRVAGNSSAGFSGDGGPADAAQLNHPAALTLDTSGAIYIADSFNGRIRRVDPNGIITTVAGTGGTGGGGDGDGGAATNAVLKNPLGVAVDAAGNLYIADDNDHRVRKVDRRGLIATMAGGGLGGDGGPANLASLDHPRGVTVDADGNLFIADYVGRRVRQVAPNGIITTVAGNGSTGYFGDGGPAVDASLGPAGVACDSVGNLYIADADNNCIREAARAGFPQLVLHNVGALDAGDYRVLITNPGGFVTSSVATLTVQAAPLITRQPARQVAILGSTVNFSVGAAGTGPFEYLWYFSAIKLLQNSSNSTLTLTNISPFTTGIGGYTVVITNRFGSVTSAVATLTMVSARTPPQIQADDPGFGFLNHGFGFNFTGAVGQTIVVDASTNLQQWTPLITNAVGGNPLYFFDPAWTNFPNRFYRARLP